MRPEISSETNTETFFRPNIFKTYIETFLLRTNVFKTDTETFFRDRDRYSQKFEKSLDTEKSRDEMSHSAVLVREAVKNVLADFFR